MPITDQGVFPGMVGKQGGLVPRTQQKVEYWFMSIIYADKLTYNVHTTEITYGKSLQIMQYFIFMG